MRPIAAGIDISDRSIEVVSLLHSKRGARVRKAGRRELPPGAVVRGVIRKPDTLVRVLAGLLDELFGRHRGTIRAATALPSSVTYARSFAFPASVGRSAAIAAAVRQGAEAFPVDMREMAGDALVTAGADGATRHVWLAVASSAVAAQYREALARAGVTPLFLDGEEMALARALGVGRPAEPVLIADIGERVTTIVVTDRDGMRMSASVPYGVERIVTAMEREQGLSLHEATGRLRKGGIAAAGEAAAKATDHIVVELLRTMEYARMRWGHKIRAVVLAGGGSLIPGIGARIEAVLGVPAGPGRPFRAVDTADAIAPGTAMLYAEALGLAMAAADPANRQRLDFGGTGTRRTRPS